MSRVSRYAQVSARRLDRRAKPRIGGSFPTRVCGVSACGEAFEVDTVLDNVSANGGYLRIGERLEPGDEVFLRVHLGSVAGSGATVDIQGTIVRVEPQPEGVFGVAVGFCQYRLL